MELRDLGPDLILIFSIYSRTVTDKTIARSLLSSRSDTLHRVGSLGGVRENLVVRCDIFNSWLTLISLLLYAIILLRIVTSEAVDVRFRSNIQSCDSGTLSISLLCALVENVAARGVWSLLI